MTAPIATEALRELWRRGGALDVLLDDSGPTGGQQAWARMLDNIPPGSWAALEVSRQRGKSWCVLTWAAQQLGVRQLSAVYLAQTGANAEAIVTEWLKDIQDSLPPEWGVVFRDGEVQFASGSKLAIFGTDNQQYRRARGRKADIVILDEAGFYADLLDVEQVYQPQLQTTRGRGVYLSSPALNPAHEFSKRCDAAKAVGRYVNDSFWSNPRINHEAVIRGEMERLGLTRAQLLASTGFRREYLAERVTEETRAAFPAWTTERAAALVGEWERPPYWDAYEALDPGKTGDPHAWLAAYYDGLCVTIEAELELRSASHTIAKLADEVKRQEGGLYGLTRWDGTLMGARDWAQEFGGLPDYLQRSISDSAPTQPYLRVGDNDGLVLNSLNAEHGLAVIPTHKHDKALEVDAVNELIARGKVRIHKRCVRLIEQLYSTIWNRTRTQWERTDRDHGDLIDCLVYLLRNVRWHRDPRPKDNRDAFALPKHMQPAAQRTGLGRLSGLKGML